MKLTTHRQTTHDHGNVRSKMDFPCKAIKLVGHVFQKRAACSHSRELILRDWPNLWVRVWCTWWRKPGNLKPRSDDGRRPEVGLVFRRCYLSVDDQEATCQEVRTGNGNWEVEIEANVSRSVFRMSGKLKDSRRGSRSAMIRSVVVNGWSSKRRKCQKWRFPMEVKECMR